MISSLLMFLVILAVGLVLLFLIRRRWADTSPAAAIAASIAVTAGTLAIGAEVMGVAVMKITPALLMASAFTGAILPQPKPWAPVSVLRALAIAAGSIALVSAISAEYVVTVLALLATGVLVVLLSNLAAHRPTGVDKPSEARESAA